MTSQVKDITGAVYKFDDVSEALENRSQIILRFKDKSEAIFNKNNIIYFRRECYVEAKENLGSVYGSCQQSTRDVCMLPDSRAVKMALTLPINKICQLFNEELYNIRKELVKVGSGDIFTQEALKGCEVEDWHMNSDNEIYVKFKNDDILKGVLKIEDGESEET